MAQHVGVDHGRRDVVMAQQLLDRPDIRAALQGVRCEAVPESVTSYVLGNACLCYCGFDRSVQGCLVDVPLDPVAVSGLGADGIMLQPHDFPHLVEQLELGIRRDQVLPPYLGPRNCATSPLTVALPLHKLSLMLSDWGIRSTQCFWANIH